MLSIVSAGFLMIKIIDIYTFKPRAEIHFFVKLQGVNLKLYFIELHEMGLFKDFDPKFASELQGQFFFLEDRK